LNHEQRGLFDVSLTKHRPSLLETRQCAALVGAPRSQWLEWSEQGLVTPVEQAQGSRAFLFHRDDLVLGVVIRALQRALGEKSPAVYPLARQAKNLVRGFLRWDGDPAVPRGLTLLLTAGATAVLVVIRPDEFGELVRRLDALA
jgi:hypothetical protein